MVVDALEGVCSQVSHMTCRACHVTGGWVWCVDTGCAAASMEGRDQALSGHQQGGQADLAATAHTNRSLLPPPTDLGAGKWIR